MRRDRDLAAPLADLHDQRHLAGRRHRLDRQREAAVRVGQRRGDRAPETCAPQRSQETPFGIAVERRARDVDDDVVERVLAGGVVDRPADRRLGRARCRSAARSTVDPGQMLVEGPDVGQAMPLAHAPQSRVPPQLLPMVPQYWPPIGVHVMGTQSGSLQTLATPEVAVPQTPLFGQVPQSRVPPQPSPIMPQKRVLAAPLQVPGTQPGSTQMPPLHCCPAGQLLLQSSARPQPLPIVPQLLPQVRATQAGPPTQRPNSQTSPRGAGGALDHSADAAVADHAAVLPARWVAGDRRGAGGGVRARPNHSPRAGGPASPRPCRSGARRRRSTKRHRSRRRHRNWSASA